MKKLIIASSFSGMLLATLSFNVLAEEPSVNCDTAE